jgi:sulfur-oxidizing protein SoxB
LGFPQDVKLAKEVSGIDILVSGHTHNRIDHAIVENGAIIFQSGCHGSYIGKLVAQVEDQKIVSFEHCLIPVDDSIADDSQMKSLIETVLLPNRATLKNVVGEVTKPLHRYSMLSAPMDDILLEAIMETAQSEIAFSNGWRYGAPIPPGPVTVEELWNIIPMNPIIQTIEMSGAELKQMLEDNLESTFAPDPYEQMGGYVKRMRGITMYFKAENPKNHRIDRLFVGESPAKKEKFYSVAFVTSQGVPAKFGRNRKKLAVDAITSLTDFFSSRKQVTPSEKQNVFEI